MDGCVVVVAKWISAGIRSQFEGTLRVCVSLPRKQIQENFRPVTKNTVQASKWKESLAKYFLTSLSHLQQLVIIHHCSLWANRAHPVRGSGRKNWLWNAGGFQGFKVSLNLSFDKESSIKKKKKQWLLSCKALISRYMHRLQIGATIKRLHFSFDVSHCGGDRSTSQQFSALNRRRIVSQPVFIHCHRGLCRSSSPSCSFCRRSASLITHFYS